MDFILKNKIIPKSSDTIYIIKPQCKNNYFFKLNSVIK
jgi:hypothetical protein